MTAGVRRVAVTMLLAALPAAWPHARGIAPAAPREGHVVIPGARIWCVDTGGDGVPVVLLHAGSGSSRVWLHQTDPFTAAGYRLVACDRRGHGRTEVDRGSRTDTTAADDVDGVARALSLGAFHLIGTAAGGIVAIDYALSFQKTLRSLVVANSIGGVQDADYLEMGRRLRPSPQFEALPVEFRELGPSYRAANPAGTRRWLELEALSRAPGVAPAQRMKNRLTFSALEAIATPTLLVTGDADLYTPHSVLRLFLPHLPFSTTAIIPEAGHSAYWEQPERFNAVVLAFLRAH